MKKNNTLIMGNSTMTPSAMVQVMHGGQRGVHHGGDRGLRAQLQAHVHQPHAELPPANIPQGALLGVEQRFHKLIQDLGEAQNLVSKVNESPKAPAGQTNVAAALAIHQGGGGGDGSVAAGTALSKAEKKEKAKEAANEAGRKKAKLESNEKKHAKTRKSAQEKQEKAAAALER